MHETIHPPLTHPCDWYVYVCKQKIPCSSFPSFFDWRYRVFLGQRIALTNAVQHMPKLFCDAKHDKITGDTHAQQRKIRDKIRAVSYTHLDVYKRQATRSAFWRILDRAKKQTGFDAARDRVLIQVFPRKSGGCEMYVTKAAPSKQEERNPIKNDRALPGSTAHVTGEAVSYTHLIISQMSHSTAFSSVHTESGTG